MQLYNFDAHGSQLKWISALNYIVTAIDMTIIKGPEELDTWISPWLDDCCPPEDEAEVEEPLNITQLSEGQWLTVVQPFVAPGRLYGSAVIKTDDQGVVMKVFDGGSNAHVMFSGHSGQFAINRDHFQHLREFSAR